MTDRERFRLLFGPYRTPVFHCGDVVHCERRGEVIITGLSSGPIAWPIGKRRQKGRARALILSADLAEAVRRAKIAAAKRGKPRPPHVGQAVAAAHRGTHHTPETRRRMSETHKRRGTRPPDGARVWTQEEDELVRTLPAAEAARTDALRRLRAAEPAGRAGWPHTGSTKRQEIK